MTRLTSAKGRLQLRCVCALAAVLAVSAVASSQPPVPTTPPAVERIGKDLIRVGQIRVDTAKHEMSVGGTVNANVTALEFIANKREGMKAYESALTLDTDAVTFNAALMLIGLDRSRVRGAPTRHFDPAAPEGDLVEIWVECPGGQCQRMPVEQLMFDKERKQPLSGGKWVYTGSTFLPDGRFLAELDGVLIGFVHDPASIIEYSAGAGLNRYGAIVPNPNVGLAPGTAISLTIAAAGQSRK